MPGLVCGPDEAPQPAHRASRMGAAIISRPRHDRNRNRRRDPPPVAPAVELGEIVRAHQPNEAIAAEAPGQRVQRVDRVAGTELPLYRGDADGKTFGRVPGRSKSRGQGGHVFRSEEHTSELQSLMRNSYAVLCLKK